MRFALLSAILLCGVSLCFSQEIRLSHKSSSYFFSENATLLDLDYQEFLTWNKVYALPSSLFTSDLDFSENRPTQWIRIKLNNTTDTTLNYYQFLYHNLDYVDSHLIDSTGQRLAQQSSGALVKLKDRPFQKFQWNHTIIPTAIPPGRHTLLLKVNNVRNYSLAHRRMSRLSLIPEQSLYQIFSSSEYINGIFLGYLLAMMLTSILLYLSERKKFYLLTSLLILCGALYPLAIDGYFFKMLVPDYPYLSIWVETLIPMASIILAHWLTASYLNVKYFAPKRLIIYYSLLAIMSMTLVPAMYSKNIFDLWVLITSASVVFTLYLAILAIKNKVRQGYYFIFGYLALIVLFIFAFVIKYFDLIHYDVATKYFNVQAPCIIFITFLLLAVMDQYSLTRRKQLQKQIKNERVIHQIETEKRLLIEQQNQELEQKIQVRTQEIAEKNKQLKNVDQIKSRFFSNISHEFRTPLTLIIGPAKNQLGKVKNDPELKHELETILTSADRLLYLINQLLDLAKVENEDIELKFEMLNSLAFVDHQLQKNFLIAQTKKVSLLFNEVGDFDLLMDAAKMQTVFSNIILNAIKLSPEHGKVSVKAFQKNEMTFFEISYEGSRIPDGNGDKILDEFYQTNTSGITQEVGLGLAIAEVYTSLHGGQIHIENNSPSGSKFIIELPNKPFAKTPTDTLVKLDDTPNRQAVELNTTNQKNGKQKLNILIVEDESLIRAYIKSCFNSHYHIHEARNGKEGLDLALEILPELIISDVMMPKMDGNAMTKALKSNMITSHIPILLLTAKAGLDSKIEGLNTGADDYLTKPFANEELIARVQSLIDNRSRLRDIYSKKINTNEQPELPALEQQFFDLVQNQILDNLSNENYDVEKLSLDLKINRTTLFRKLKAIGAKNPSQFIRSVRLNEALKRLKTNKYTISEVSFAVGFNSTNYFSTMFKEKFGVPPSAYLKKEMS